MAAAVCFVFFLSGASALLFETLWFRLAGLALGNSVWASSLVLASFMAGLAVGNALAARFGARLRRPVAVYAALEVVIGASGLGLVLVFPLLTQLLAPLLSRFLEQPFVLNPLRLALGFGLMLLPTTAMGATLPLLAKALSSGGAPFGQALGRLYGWNTLGAVVGALAGEGLLIEPLGLRGTGYAAAALNGVAALTAVLLARRSKLATPNQPLARPPLATRPWALRLFAAAFLSGAILLALEVVWFRFLLLFVHATSFTFAVMLSVVLLGISLGGLLAAAWIRAQPTAHRFTPHVALVAGWLCVQVYVGFDRPPGPQLSAYVTDPWLVLLASLWLILPVCLLSGVLFTLLGSALGFELGEPARTTGLLTLANTVGAMAGALLAGFVLLPRLGIEWSVYALALGYGGVALCAARAAFESRRAALALGAAVLAYVLPLLLFPFGLMRNHYLPAIARPHMVDGSRIVAFREGLTETVIYLRRDVWGRPLQHRLLTNGFSMSGTDPLARRYMKLFVYWPIALHPAPRTALLISYGVGSTAKALTDTASLESIDVVDISRDILELSDVVFPEPGTDPLDDPRVRVHVEDGRFFLQTSPLRFDLITAEPPPPKNAGIGNLYSKEYFQLMYERLAQGGVATYWLPVFELELRESKAIMAAFCSAFEDCSLWTGAGLEWMLVGTRQAVGPGEVAAFERQWRDPVVGPEIRDLGLETPEQIGALFIGDAAFLAELTKGEPPLEDNYPQRLSPHAPVGDLWPYLALMDVSATQRRFEQSPFVRRLWPEPLRTRTLGFFDYQRVFNELVWGAYAPPERIGVADLHHVLTRSPLRALPVMLMGSQADRQRVAREAVAAGLRGPGLDFELSVAAMARRDYATAARLLERVQAAQPPGGAPASYWALALGLSGDPTRAAQLARELKHTGRVDTAAWSWLEQTFAADRLPR